LKSSLIKEKALELGFHLVGIAPTVRFPETTFYRQWIAQGFAGKMDYMSRNVEKREDCQVLFPPVRSVIVCGMSYHSSITDSEEHSQTSKGWISRYAWGDDYHTILKNKLDKLLKFIQKESSVPIEAKVCVDSVPILERIYGKYAGLGWIGKNSCLINQQYGSWFFLGEILINLQLEYDSPVSDRCGTCTRCLDVCPTGALIAPHILDARKCISYLTIEFKGIIPEEFRSAIGNNVFGCDRCQEVCPWNQKAKVPENSSFLLREHLYYPSFEWLFSLSSESFSKVFRNNPIKRTKLRGLLRNTAVAIGNSGDASFAPLLRDKYNTYEPLVQIHIDWALFMTSSKINFSSFLSKN
jgi:epoxyqueuosine reductase